MTSQRIEGVDFRMYLEPSQPGSWTYVSTSGAMQTSLPIDAPSYRHLTASTMQTTAALRSASLLTSKSCNLSVALLSHKKLAHDRSTSGPAKPTRRAYQLS